MRSAGTRDLEHFEASFQCIMDERIQAALAKADLSSSKTGENSKETTTESEPEKEAGEPRNSGESTESFMSATTCAELQELELLQKSIDSQITIRRAASQASVPRPTNQRFVPLVDKVQQRMTVEFAKQQTASTVEPVPTPSVIVSGATSACGQPPRTTPSAAAGAPPLTPGDKPSAESQSTASGPNSGVFSDEWFAAKMMNALHVMDGKDSLHHHLDEKLLEAIAQGQYVDFAKLLKDEVDDSEGIQMIMQNCSRFTYQPQNHPEKLRVSRSGPGHFWSSKVRTSCTFQRNRGNCWSTKCTLNTLLTALSGTRFTLMTSTFAECKPRICSGCGTWSIKWPKTSTCSNPWKAKSLRGSHRPPVLTSQKVIKRGKRKTKGKEIFAGDGTPRMLVTSMKDANSNTSVPSAESPATEQWLVTSIETQAQKAPKVKHEVQPQHESNFLTCATRLL